VPTRNSRLASIRSFFQYVAQTDPRHLAHCQSILSVKFKRHAHRTPEYLERQEVLKILAEINCQTPLGRRDDALLRLLYNTGMRAQELVTLDASHVRFSRPYRVRILGKGRKSEPARFGRKRSRPSKPTWLHARCASMKRSPFR
jgi:integrase/recombinase XerC